MKHSSNWFSRWIERLFSRKSRAPTLSDKIIVELADGRCALVDNDDDARAVAMSECLRSGHMITAQFRRATVDEVAAFDSQTPITK